MKVQELLTDESKWTQDTSARARDGKPVSPQSQRAVCWCLVGAIVRCYPSDDDNLAAFNKARRVIEPLIPFYSDTFGAVVSMYNDSATFADIRRVIEQADI